MSKKNKPAYCEECFALIEECDCEAEAEEDFEKSTSKPRGKWEPNIKKNEKWFNVPSDYKAYKDGV